jgi:hypothetical protein
MARGKKARPLVPVVHGKDRQALKALIKVYGDDVDSVLNGLHAIGARVAIAAGVDPQEYADGLKHHWNFVAEIINEAAQERERANVN